MSGVGHNDGNCHGVYVPAWGCKVVTRADQACVHLKFEEFNLYVASDGSVSMADPGDILTDGGYTIWPAANDAATISVIDVLAGMPPA